MQKLIDSGPCRCQVIVKEQPAGGKYAKGFGFFAWSGLRGLGVTAVTLGLLHITQLLESFDILKYGFFNTGGALSSISLSIERAPPLRNSPHTGFSFLD